MAKVQKKAVFWDRDGVLTELIERGDGIFTAPWHVTEFKLIDGIREALENTRKYGFLNIVITNQPDCGLLLHEYTMTMWHQWMFHTLALDAIYAEINRDSPNYKPGTNQFKQAANAYGVDLKRSWNVGDTWKDIEAGKALNLRNIFVHPLGRTAYEKPPEGCYYSGPPEYTVRSTIEAADLITHKEWELMKK